MEHDTCVFCRTPGGAVLWQDDLLRIVRVEDAPGYPGFCRLILQAHVKEMTDLNTAERKRVMNAVWALETVLRKQYRPLKINLAQLGNVVPHVHWHVIPRFADDPNFPDPVWSPPRREGAARVEVADAVLRAGLAEFFA